MTTSTKRPDYGNAKPEDLARALLRPPVRNKEPNGRSRRTPSTPAKPA